MSITPTAPLAGGALGRVELALQIAPLASRVRSSVSARRLESAEVAQLRERPQRPVPGERDAGRREPDREAAHPVEVVDDEQHERDDGEGVRHGERPGALVGAPRIGRAGCHAANAISSMPRGQSESSSVPST